MQHPNGRRRALGALAATAICPGLALAQASYPDRPIKYLVPYTAGGGADFIARVVAEGLTKHLGQPVIVENRPGASGVIATQLGANAAPDGYTILLAGVDALAFNTAMFDKLPYDPQKDFTYVSLQAKLDMMVVVREESFSPTMSFDAALRRRLETALPGAPVLETGAGHDAGVLAARLPAAMLFVRNPSGVSHSPEEHVEDADAERGAEALAGVLMGAI